LEVLDNRMNNEQQLMNQIKKYGLNPTSGFAKIKRNASGWPGTAVDGTHLRFIEDCRGRHKDEEIWILGSGPSLDSFPDNFFNSEEKIAIAVKMARVAFPDCTYFQDSYRGALNHAFILNKRLNLLEKYIFLLPGCFQPDWPRGYNDKPIYQRTHHRHPSIRNLIQNIMEAKTRGYVYPEYGTVMHYAIETAVIFGARRIILVGCEHKAVNGQNHALKRGMSFYYSSLEKKPLWFAISEGARATVQKGTVALAQAFKPYGIKIEKYFYNKGYEALV